MNVLSKKAALFLAMGFGIMSIFFGSFYVVLCVFGLVQKAQDTKQLVKQRFKSYILDDY
jgi:hypothetical protein